MAVPRGLIALVDVMRPNGAAAELPHQSALGPPPEEQDARTPPKSTKPTDPLSTPPHIVSLDQENTRFILSGLGFKKCLSACPVNGRRTGSVLKGSVDSPIGHFHKKQEQGHSTLEFRKTRCSRDGESRVRHVCGSSVAEVSFGVCLEEKECEFSTSRKKMESSEENTSFAKQIIATISEQFRASNLQPKPSTQPNSSLQPQQKVIIHFVRHAQAEHNLGRQFNVRDPKLTFEGRLQCIALRCTFDAKITHVLTSPLRRTLQTTERAFGYLIRSNQLQLIAHPDLREWGSSNSSTGYNRTRQQKWVQEQGIMENLDWTLCDENWHWKGVNEADRKMSARAERVRIILRKMGDKAKRGEEWEGITLNKVAENENVEILVVGHGGFLGSLLGQSSGSTDPLGNTEWRSCEFSDDPRDPFTLVETEESIDRRGLMI